MYEESIKDSDLKAVSYSKQPDGIPAFSLSLTVADALIFVIITAVKLGKTILSFTKQQLEEQEGVNSMARAYCILTVQFYLLG